MPHSVGNQIVIASGILHPEHLTYIINNTPRPPSTPAHPEPYRWILVYCEPTVEDGELFPGSATWVYSP